MNHISSMNTNKLGSPIPSLTDIVLSSIKASKRQARSGILLVVMVATSVSASELIDGSSPKEVLDLAQIYGRATMNEDSVGDPMIRGHIDDAGYDLYFYGCIDNRDCTSIEFRAWWDSDKQYTLDEMNAWNGNYRFGRAYINDQGDPLLSMNVNLTSGVTKENLNDNFRWWLMAIKDFETDVVNQ